MNKVLHLVLSITVGRTYVTSCVYFPMWRKLCILIRYRT